MEFIQDLDCHSILGTSPLRRRFSPQIVLFGGSAGFL